MTEPAERQFDVHLFPVVRVKVSGVAAPSHEAAVDAAIRQVANQLHERFTESGADYCEEFSHFLVDVVDDPQYEQSRWFYSRDEPLLTLLERLVAWFAQGATDDQEIERLVSEAQESLRFVV